MVFVVNPDIVLVNVPVPLPSAVVVSAIVGLAVKLQHTPLAVTAAPQSEMTLPPLVAEVSVMLVTGDVVTVGGIEAPVEFLRQREENPPALLT